MKIINNEQPDRAHHTAARNIYTGVFLIAAGIIWMCHNLDMIGERFFDALFSWQMLLMVLGGYFLMLRKWALGTVTLMIGAIFAISEWFNLYLPVSDLLLPMIVVAVGIVILLQQRK